MKYLAASTAGTKTMLLSGLVLFIFVRISSTAPSSSHVDKENHRMDRVLEDEEVLELDSLKDSLHGVNYPTHGEVLPALQRQLTLNTGSLATNIGQPEEEEQSMEQHHDNLDGEQSTSHIDAHEKEHENERIDMDGSNNPLFKNAEFLLRHRGGELSSLDMAQYVFWTGDEEGVAKAVEEFIQKGLMSRENAIKFLRDISMGIEYLENSYTNHVQHDPAGDGHQNHVQTKKTSILPTRIPPPPPPPPLPPQQPSQPSSTTMPKAPIQGKPTISPAIQKTIQNLPSLLKLNEITNERNKAAENSIDYDEINGRLRLADFLYAEYSLEEVIYQLAKVMFSQSLTRGSEQAEIALQRLTTFLESEGANGRISPVLQKKVLDVLLAALSDCLTEHPELLSAAQAGVDNSLNQIPKGTLKQSSQ